MLTSDFSPEVEIWPFRACAMHPAIIIGTVRSLWTWLWGRYHVPQNAFLVLFNFIDQLNNICYIVLISLRESSQTVIFLLSRYNSLSVP